MRKEEYLLQLSPSTFLLIQNWSSKPITHTDTPDQLIRGGKMALRVRSTFDTDQAELTSHASAVPGSS